MNLCSRTRFFGRVLEADLDEDAGLKGTRKWSSVLSKPVCLLESMAIKILALEYELLHLPLFELWSVLAF